ncbi:hypothetical protein JCGZ_03917 [Jatropha curcas]|uniref:Uncharacterized protein n=1 Tax=Jatropha curcas TaxID=180498 RepID=A0A067LR70_JATCU|nr:hypothetical protein JCGZ_03917 [Jatropha curcas]
MDHLAAFMPGAYTIFVRIQLLVHIPPLIKFDPFAEAEELDRGQGSALVQLSSSASWSIDQVPLSPLFRTAQGMLEMHLISPFRMSPPSCTHVSISDCNEVCQLYRVACLELAVQASMAPPAGRGRGTQHGRRASYGVGRRLMIIKETEETSSGDSEETASNMS